MPEEYRNTVFINCPFDEEYGQIQNYIIFAILYLGFEVQIASQIQGAEHNRLAKIQNMIGSSQFSIHDISRLKSTAPDEFYRLNMPLELGMDMGAKRYCEEFSDKKFLIFEAEQYTADKAASDLKGFDLRAHEDNASLALKQVRDWLENVRPNRSDGAMKIEGAFLEFIEAFYNDRIRRGFNEEHAKNAAVGELIGDMKHWLEHDELPEQS